MNLISYFASALQTSAEILFARFLQQNFYHEAPRFCEERLGSEPVHLPAFASLVATHPLIQLPESGDVLHLASLSRVQKIGAGVASLSRWRFSYC